jgi:hypothetical protein
MPDQSADIIFCMDFTRCALIFISYNSVAKILSLRWLQLYQAFAAAFYLFLMLQNFTGDRYGDGKDRISEISLKSDEHGLFGSVVQLANVEEVSRHFRQFCSHQFIL